MNIRLNEEDSNILVAMAAHSGLTKSDIIRVAIRRLAISMGGADWKFKKPAAHERGEDPKQNRKAHGQ